MARPKGIVSKTSHKWTGEQVKYLESIAKGNSMKDITLMINEKFNLELNHIQVKNKMKACGIKNGIDPKFKKGDNAWNKGLKGVSKRHSGSFKKGREATNKRPMYSEIAWHNGYKLMKIADNDWVLKHRWIYEQHHGPIPAGYVVIFADKNKDNYNIDNLVLVKRSELLIANKNKLIYEDTELTKTGINVARLMDKVKELK